MNLSAVEKGRSTKSWTISLGERLTATCVDGGNFSLRREEVVKNLVILDGLIFRRTLSFKKPVKKILQMDSQSYIAFENWLGFKTVLTMFLKQRFSWIIAIGVLFIIGSLPMPGDAQTGIKAIPFNPLNCGMGFSLLLIGFFSKRFPDRMYFLVDSGWFFLLAITTLIDAFRKGSSIFWLIFVMLQLSLVVSGILLWHRLGKIEKGL
jgi:hypothetical protein